VGDLAVVIEFGVECENYKDFFAPTMSANRSATFQTTANSITRRRFLWSGFAAGFGLSVAPSTCAKKASTTAPGFRPANLIFCVSDGMSGGVLCLAEAFSLQTRGRGTRWALLLRESGVTHGLMDTASLDSLVTDSAAASSAWGGARRVNNGSINILPDGTASMPIGRLAKAHGLGFGLVTTATVTHATPAGFAANVPARSEEFEIAPQYLDCVDVILGGGSLFFDPSKRPDGVDLIQKFSQSGYAIVRNREELANATGSRKILGLFAEGHLPFVIDRPSDPSCKDRVPTLAEATSSALRLLAGRGTGFLLQIEGARVDHAAHHNDIATLLHEQLDFDDALGVALDFAEKDGNTLIIVTSDHGNSNPGLNGTGPAYTESTTAFAKIAGATGSFYALSEWAGERIKNGEAPEPHEFAARAAETLGFYPSHSEAMRLLEYLSAKFEPDWSIQHANYWGLLGRVAGNHFSTGWTGISHTSDYTIVTAKGPGAERFAGLLRNDTIGAYLRELLDLEAAAV